MPRQPLKLISLWRPGLPWPNTPANRRELQKLAYEENVGHEWLEDQNKERVAQFNAWTKKEVELQRGLAERTKA
jgi:hypothetical protein